MAFRNPGCIVFMLILALCHPFKRVILFLVLCLTTLRSLLVINLPSQNRRDSAYYIGILITLYLKINIPTISFWTDLRSKKCDFPSLASWWDFGKSHIKSLSQMYGSKIAKEKRKACSARYSCRAKKQFKLSSQIRSTGRSRQISF